MKLQKLQKVLAFTNNGTLDLNFVRIMGVSVKEKDSPIGFFGTGLKYAIATILRHGGGIAIRTGGKRHIFSVADVTIRGETFSQVVMDGEPLGFTTQLGKQWEPWMAVRELYSNTLDESGSVSVIGCLPKTVAENETCIGIWGEPFLKVWENRKEYFLDSREAMQHSSLYIDSYKSHQKSTAIFFRGIKVGDSQLPCMFRHNILRNVKLTEDRTLQYSWEFNEAIERAVITSDDDAFIRDILLAPSDFHEGCLSFTDSHTQVEPSEMFKKVMDMLSKHRPDNFNSGAERWYSNRTNSKRAFDTHEMTTTQSLQMSRAIAAMGLLGLGDDLAKYPIRVVRWLGASVHGLAKDGVIYISKECFDRGTKYVFSTLLEEFVHCHHGFRDCSRDLQTFLFDKVCSMTEEFILKEPI